MAALGFVLLILAGNGLICYALLGLPVPGFLSMGFGLAVLMAAVGGIFLGMKIIRQRWVGVPPPSGEE